MRVEPLRSRTVVIQFDAVAVRVSQVHRDPRAVVLRPVYRVAAIQESPNGVAEFAAAGVEEGEVLESGVSFGGWCSTLASPGVQADVVVVAPRREECRARYARVGAVGRDVEAQHVAVEGGRAIEVGDAQVDVSEAYVRMRLGFVHPIFGILWPIDGRVNGSMHLLVGRRTSVRPACLALVPGPGMV